MRLGRNLVQRPSPQILSYRSIPRARATVRQKSTTTASESAASGSAKPSVNGKVPQSPKTSEATQPAAKEGEVPTSIFWRSLEPVMHHFRSFDRLQARRPLAVQFGASIIVYAFGDVVAQSIEDTAYDPKRTIRNMVIGGIISVPGYKWFMFLSHNFNYRSYILSMATRLSLQQLCFAPVFSTYFFAMQALLSGQSFEGAVERVKRALPQAWVNSLKLWPAVTVLTFTFVKPQYRFMVSGVVAVFWQGYLSWLNQRESRRARGEHGDVPQPKLAAAAA